MKNILCPSMMCANFEELKKEIRLLEEAGADIFHLDVMDGNFVRNFGLGLQDIKVICNNSNIDVDLHLMVNNPRRYIKKFAQLGVDIIYIHPETESQTIKVLQELKELKIKPGIVISPEMTIENVRYMLYFVDYVLIMTVNLGFSGQKYLDFVNSKIDKLLMEKNRKYKIIIDGACSKERIKELKRKGVDGFILGTAALFKKDRNYKEIMEELRAI